MKKNNARYLIIGIITTVILATIGVTYAYWRGQIQGEGSEMVVSFGKAKVIFTDTTEIRESDAKPGWSTTKSFTIANEGDKPFKYDIYIKDLVNTLVTEGFLQYKITSTNGYNMTEYLPIEKSSESVDSNLKMGLTIEGNSIQEYTIEIRYTNSPDINQSEDMGKSFSGQLMIRETYDPTGEKLYSVLTNGKMYPVVNARTNFDEVFGTEQPTTGVIYKESVYKESGNDVYYFAGNVSDNWVKFAGFYWRIIRTNEDGSVRLLYAGSSPDTTEGYIGESEYTSSYDNTMYVGWMYGSEESIEANRGYTNSAPIKIVVDNWYRDNIANNESYNNLVSTDAIYCNDRAAGEYASSGLMYYAARNRLDGNQTQKRQPSYQCGQNSRGGYYTISNTWISNTSSYTSSAPSIKDKFSKTTGSGGNGKLTYPVGLITADETAFAGGLYAQYSPNTYYYLNSIGGSVVGEKWWWTMSPSDASGSSYPGVFIIHSSTQSSCLASDGATVSSVVRPVISIKPEVIVTKGKGTSISPYELSN